MGLLSIRMGSIGTGCVYPVCSADDMWAGVHVFQPDQPLGVEFIQEGIGGYAEVSGGDEDRLSPSEGPEAGTVPTAGEHDYESNKGGVRDYYTNGRFGAGAVAVVLERFFLPVRSWSAIGHEVCTSSFLSKGSRMLYWLGL